MALIDRLFNYSYKPVNTKRQKHNDAANTHRDSLSLASSSTQANLYCSEPRTSSLSTSTPDSSTPSAAQNATPCSVLSGTLCRGSSTSTVYIPAPDARVPEPALDPSTPPATCLIIQLDLDTLNCIMDYLSAADQMILLHTCSALFHSLIHRVRLTRKSLCKTGHRQYILRSYKDKPNWYICIDCKSPHRLDEKNLPSHRKVICPKEKAGRVHGSSLLGPFQLDYGHVQLACKLSQMDQTALPLPYKRFLGNTLSEFHLTTYYTPHTSTDYPAEFRALARVIKGKLYLKRMWRYQFKRFVRGDKIEDIFGSLQVCPHMTTSLDQNPGHPEVMIVESTFLTRPIISAICLLDEKDYPASCPVCATDVIIYTRKGYITVMVWQLLGGCDLGSQKYWQGHAWKRNWPVKQDEGSARGEQERGSLIAVFEQEKAGKFVRW